MLEFSKNVEMTSGRSTSLVQRFPKPSVNLITYGFPGVVLPALWVMTKNKVVLRLKTEEKVW